MLKTPTVILSACRTAIGSFGGALKNVAAPDLGAVVIREAIARASVAPHEVGDVIMGCVLQGGAGMNVARQAALEAGMPPDVPAETVNRVCGSGLQAVVHAAEALQAGYVDLVIAGGTESMSNASASVTGTLPIPITATPADVRELFDKNRVRNGRVNYAPVLVAALAR